MGMDHIAGGHKRIGVVLLAAMLGMFAAGCKKKTTAPPPPPPPPPAVVKEKPARPVVASFEAEPRTIERGQAATLRWSVSGETTDVRIDPGIGTVSATGNRQVYPGNSTTYTLTASGPGGTASSTASVTVTAPAAPPPPPPPTAKTTVDQYVQRLEDALFDYDSSTIREDARAILSRNSDVLKSMFSDHPSAVVVLEGHCDERGSAEYNLGLGDRRATAVKEFLVQLGVAADRLRPVSFGKERPQCTESNEGCWQRNRRAHFSRGQ